MSLNLTAEDAAISSRHGGFHSGVLWVRAEDGIWQSNDHRRGLDDDSGVRAMPDAGLVAAADQQGWAKGPAQHALFIAGHVLGLQVNLGERVGRKRSTGKCEEQNVFIHTRSKKSDWDK